MERAVAAFAKALLSPRLTAARSPLGISSSVPRTGSLTLWNARLWTAGVMIARARGGRRRGRLISGVSDCDGAAPAGAVDVDGRTVMPGLIDAHNHVTSDVSRSPGFGPPAALHGESPRPRELGYFVLANAAAAFLRGGITAVRDVGCYDDEALVLGQALELGLLDGPRLSSCGRIISATAPGGPIFAPMYRQADGPWEMRKAVREQISRGAGFVKVMATGAAPSREDPEPAQMTREELRDRRRGAPHQVPRGSACRGARGDEDGSRGGCRHRRARARAPSRSGTARGDGRPRNRPRRP
jgi:hypothetical protein